MEIYKRVLYMVGVAYAGSQRCHRRPRTSRLSGSAQDQLYDFSSNIRRGERERRREGIL